MMEKKNDIKLSDKQIKKLDNGREYRAMTMQIRKASEEDGNMSVEGYATTFDDVYTLYDSRTFKILEKIDPHAFDDCDMSDVIMQYDHEGRVFARTRNNTLSLTTDTKGLLIRANLGGTDIGKQLYQEIKGGYTDRMSFGFIVGEDNRTTVEDYENDVETVTRTITKISKLYDVSAVSLPANDMTSISARKYSNGLIKELETERNSRALKKKKLELKLKLLED